MLALLVAGCGSPTVTTKAPESSVPGSPTAVTAAEAAPTLPGADATCATGALRVGDLPSMDRDWRAGLEAAARKAISWQPDAVLSSLRVACQLFEPTLRWQATYYSADAQAFYASDTGEVTPSSIEEGNVPKLPMEDLSFGLLHRALIKSGFDDATEISPSTGVDVRMNTEASPFGPPDAPKDVILYHVAIDRLGETRDLFVDGRDGLIHRYSS